MTFEAFFIFLALTAPFWFELILLVILFILSVGGHDEPSNP